jgi:diacylglycerol kinase family enzyme
LLNASCGITAQANWLFNHPDRLLHFLKKTCTALAILYAAIKTILTFKGIYLEYGADRKHLRFRKISNIAFMKSPYCSGSFCYDAPYHPDNGRFWVHTCLETHRLRLLKILACLTRHRFMGSPGTESFETTRFVLKSNNPFALEMDGEVVQVLEAHFAVLPRAIRVCQA